MDESDFTFSWILFLTCADKEGSTWLINYSYVHLFCLDGCIELKLDKNANVPTCSCPGVVPCGAMQQRQPEVYTG